MGVYSLCCSSKGLADKYETTLIVFILSVSSNITHCTTKQKHNYK